MKQKDPNETCMIISNWKTLWASWLITQIFQRCKGKVRPLKPVFYAECYGIQHKKRASVVKGLNSQCYLSKMIPSPDNEQFRTPDEDSNRNNNNWTLLSTKGTPCAQHRPIIILST